MAEWVVYLICALICIGTVVIFDIFKAIAKAIVKKKGKEINMKKAEYPIATITMAISFGAVFLFLYFGKFLNLQLFDILKLCGIYASASQGFYLFIVQLPKKGWIAIHNSIKKLITIIKSNKNPIDKVTDFVDAIEKENEETNNIENSEQAKKQFFDTLKKY